MNIKSIFSIENLLIFVIIIFSLLRIYYFYLPTDKIFDEVYFPVMANELLTKGTFYDVHPPTGKLIIALCEMIFGNTPFAWRFTQVVCGILLIYIVYLFVKEFFQDKLMGLICAVLFAIDGLFIVYSRVGLIDIFMVLFGFIALYYIARFKNHPKITYYLYLSGLFLGLTISVKWIGLGFYLIIFTLATYQIFSKKPNLKQILHIFLSLVFVPLLIYVISFIPLYKLDLFAEIIKWHFQVWHYHIDLSDPHIYGSKWWSWPLMIRPIWFYYDESHKIVKGIIALANPLLLWSSTIALLVGLGFLVINIFNVVSKKVKKINLELWFLLLSWLIFYLPWAFISRVIFFYHYMLAYSFALILLGYWLNFIHKKNKLIFYFLISLFIAVSVIYIPLWIAYPVNENYYSSLMLFKKWI